MFGINPIVVAQVLAPALLKELLSDQHGAIKIMQDQIAMHIAKHDIELAKVMARSVASQDAVMFEELKKKLQESLSVEDYRQMFPDG